MKNTLPFVACVLISALLCLVMACEAPTEPTFQQMKNVKVKELKGNHLVVTADALFHNPNDYGIKLTGIDLDVEIDDKEAGKVMQVEPIQIPAASDFTVPVTADLDIKSLTKDFFKNALNLLKSKKVKVHYEGIITVQALNIALDIPVDYTEEIPLR